MKLLILFFSLLIACQSPSIEITTFILVRHAEKADDGTKNPPLTEFGIQRAETLGEFLSEVDIEAIYSTDYQRTLQTARPIAEQRGLTIQNYEPTEFDDLATTLLANNKGKTILISGHSNTTPRLVNAFLGSDIHEDLADSEYDWVYIVDVVDIGTANVKKLKVTVN